MHCHKLVPSGYASEVLLVVEYLIDVVLFV